MHKSAVGPHPFRRAPLGSPWQGVGRLQNFVMSMLTCQVDRFRVAGFRGLGFEDACGSRRLMNYFCARSWWIYKLLWLSGSSNPLRDPHDQWLEQKAVGLGGSGPPLCNPHGRCFDTGPRKRDSTGGREGSIRLRSEVSKVGTTGP